MELKDLIAMICNAKKEADFDPNIFSFYDPKDDLKEAVLSFCDSNKSILFVPRMFTAYNNSRCADITMFIVKIDSSTFEESYIKSVIDLDQFVKLYGKDLPLNEPLEKEFDGVDDISGKKKDSFILLVNDIGKKCRDKNFRVDTQILDSKIIIHQCENEGVNLVMIGFKI